jgi:putative cell wall-binding protein
MRTALSTLLVCLAVFASVVASNASATAAPGITSVSRYSGADRYEVAVNIAHEYAPNVDVVYIAKGTDYPDALSAAPAAAASHGPLLLTQPNTLPQSVRAELQRLTPKKIVVVGGTASVSEAVFDELSTLGDTIRLSGADRYEASRNVVDYAFGSTGASRVYVATGANYPDALSASAAAGARNGAVLLVNGKADTAPVEITELITKLGVNDAVIAGGPNSVTTGIEASIAAMGLPGGSQRLGGSDRYEASRNINVEAFDSADTAFIATGLKFPDALAGAALAGHQGSPLFIVPGTCVPFSVVGSIEALGSSRLVILGGPNSVSPAVESLTPCASTPAVSIQYSCGSGLFVGVTNPNPFGIVYTYGIDYNRDGLDDARTEGTIGANESATVTDTTLGEDTTSDVRVYFRGGTIANQPVHVDCVPPPPPPPPANPGNPGDSVNCGDFRNWADAQNWFNTYYPAYGDVAKLDQDNDGIACESLPGHP